MRRFWLDRKNDSTGVSGTGTVARGVMFGGRHGGLGKCVMQWLSKHSSVAVYDSLEDLVAIHGHDGDTVVRWHEDDVICWYCGGDCFGSHEGGWQCLACSSGQRDPHYDPLTTVMAREQRGEEVPAEDRGTWVGTELPGRKERDDE